MNFFAALDDSDDEIEEIAPQKEVSYHKNTVTSKKLNGKSSSIEPVVGPSRSEQRRQQDRAKKSSSGRSAPREGKRAYERRSGTGRGREIKKSGGGARNWGSDKNDARSAQGLVFEGDSREEEENMQSGDTDLAPEKNGNTSDAVDGDEPPQGREEDKTMTYDEYLKGRDAKRIESDAFKPLVTKDFDDNEFAGLTVKEKPKEEEETYIATGNRVKQPKKKKNIKTKDEIVPSFRVQESNNPRRRRENKDKDKQRHSGTNSRGVRRYNGDNRRNSRGVNKNDRTKQVELNVADMSSFPTL